jgi:hypothetical protein
MSQQRIAEIARCSVSMVRLLEAGYQPSSGDVAQRVARAVRSLKNEDPAAGPGLRETSADGDGRHGKTP